MMFIMVYVTTANKEEAQKIARALLSEKLAACVNISHPIASLYWWQGKVEESTEALMLIKTTKSLFAPLSEKVKEWHSYTVPEIIAVPIVDGQRDYLDWVQDSVR